MSRTPRTELDAAMQRQGRMSKWLAAEIGADESQVSRWRKGIHVPEEATREKIACALGLHVDAVFPPEGSVAA